MKTFELPIVVEYLSNWTIEDGVRELIQNAIDAKTEFGGEMEIDYVKATNTLRICNQNCTLPLEALLIGHTTKANRDDMRGKYGEGFKFGVNVLERNQCSVKIRTGGEVWAFNINRSKLGFNADVLFCTIVGGRKPEKRVRIEIKNIAPEKWEEIKKRFLFLQGDYESYACEYGEILLDEEMKGKVFVKGIFVEHDKDLGYGYDLHYTNVDRDRKMAETHSKMVNISNIWANCLKENGEIIGRAYGLFSDEAKIDLTHSYYVDWGSENIDNFIKIFKSQHGADTFPVSNYCQKQDLGHLGVTAVVLPNSLAAILQQKMGSYNKFYEKLKNEKNEEFDHDTLEPHEYENLKWAVALVDFVEGVELDDVKIVNYRSDNIEGMFTFIRWSQIENNRRQGEVSLARKILNNRYKTLQVLIHEVAHRYGGDGEKNHVAAIERIWREVSLKLVEADTPKRVSKSVEFTNNSNSYNTIFTESMLEETLGLFRKDWIMLDPMDPFGTNFLNPRVGYLNNNLLF